MAKTSKKALGAAMAGVMAVGAVAGAVNAVQEVKAGVAEDIKLIDAKLSHFNYSLKKNYLGLKNVAQWQAYEKEIKTLIGKLPTGSQKDSLQARLDVCVSLLNAAAKVNHVEKSLVTNYNGIKNAETWSVYLKDGNDLLAKVDKELEGRKAELVERLAKAKATVDGIIAKHNTDLAAAEALFTKAQASMNLVDAKAALVAAEALGTHSTSDALEAKCKALIAQIEGVNVEVKTVEVVGGTFDDNTNGQKLSVKVNGELMNIDFLKAVGYNIKFNATDLDGVQVNNTIFDGSANAGDTSSTGKISNAATAGKYNVQLTVQKGGSIVVSEKATVIIDNIDSTATSISEVKMVNSVSQQRQVSSNLLVNEEVSISDVKVSNGSIVSDASAFKITSSNEAVISVDNAAQKIKAVSLGTAKITVTTGKVTKEFTYTVKAGERKVAQITPSSSAIKVLAGNDATVKLTAADQYGDPISLTYAPTAANAGNKVEIVKPNTSDVVNNAVVANIATGVVDGVQVATITAGAVKGSDTVLFKDMDGKILARISVATSTETGVATTKFEVVPDKTKLEMSDDYTIYNTAAGSDDSKIVVGINEYSKEGVLIGPVDLSSAPPKDIVSSDTKVVVTGTSTGLTITADGAKPGNYDVIVTVNGKATKLVVTVKEPSVMSLTGVTFTNYMPLVGQTISAADVLKLNTSSAGDAEILSVKLSAATPHKVRLSAAGKIYIDGDDDARYDAAEAKNVVLGELRVSATGTFATGGASVITVDNFIAGSVKLKGTDKGNVIISVNVDLNKNGTIDDNEMLNSTTISIN